MCIKYLLYLEEKTRKTKYFFPGKNVKSKIGPTVSYNLPHESYEKSPVTEIYFNFCLEVHQDWAFFLRIGNF